MNPLFMNQGMLDPNNPMDYGSPFDNQQAQQAPMAEQQMLDPSRFAYAAALQNIGNIAGNQAPQQNIGGAYMAAKQSNDRNKALKSQQDRQAGQDQLNIRYRESQIAKNKFDVTGGPGHSPDQIKLERDARKDYSTGFNAFGKQALNNKKLETALMSGSGAGDYAAVISFVKSLDPDSVVREGEAAMAADVAGIYEKLLMIGNKLKEGDTLAPEVKADYLNLSNQWLSAASVAQSTKYDDAQYRANLYGYDQRAVLGQAHDFGQYQNRAMVDASYFGGVAPPPPIEPPAGNDVPTLDQQRVQSNL